MNKKDTNKINYLFLAFLPFLTVMTFEYFKEELQIWGVPMETLAVVVAALYVATGGLLKAFVASTKLKPETKYILYLMILAIVVLKSLDIIKLLAG